LDALRTIAVFQLPLSSLFTGNFMNHNFSLPVGIHATYLSMYVAFSIVTFLWLLLTSQVQKQKWLYIIASLFLFAGLVQLSSRAVFIAFLLIINGVFSFLVFSGSKRLKFIFTTALVSAAILLLIYSVDSFKTRYVSELKTDLTDKVKIVDNTEPRLARWEVILELVRRSPLIGYGSGSEAELLKEKYFEKGLYVSYINEFNTHNQYLAMLLKAGVAGLLLFLFILYYGYLAAIRRKDLLLLAFMLMITIVSLSENILDLNKGIFFYGFFFSLLLMKPADIDERGNPKELNAV
jgi:O-antigen ligase